MRLWKRSARSRSGNRLNVSGGSPSIRPVQRLTTTSRSSPKRPAINSVITPRLRPLDWVSATRQRLVGAARAWQAGVSRSVRLLLPMALHRRQASLSLASSCGRIRLSTGLSNPAWLGVARAPMASAVAVSVLPAACPLVLS